MKRTSADFKSGNSFVHFHISNSKSEKKSKDELVYAFPEHLKKKKISHLIFFPFSKRKRKTGNCSLNRVFLNQFPTLKAFVSATLMF